MDNSSLPVLARDASSPMTRGMAAGEDASMLLSPIGVMAELEEIPELSERQRTIYGTWIQGYLRYIDREQMGMPRPSHIKRFLSQIQENDATDEETYQTAAEALVFYHECLLQQTIQDDGFRLATLTGREKEKLISRLDGPEKVLARVVCNTDLNLKEALRLRVGDVDLNKESILVSSSTGSADRVVSFPASMKRSLQQQLDRVKELHESDLADGFGSVDVPTEVTRQFPWAAKQLVWQYLFPSRKRTLDMRAGTERRYPMNPKRIFNAIEYADAPLTTAFHAFNTNRYKNTTSSNGSSV